MLSSSSASSSRTDYTASASAVSLPKGGGAIQGIGEKFSVNPVTVTGASSVPIAVSPGRGFAPELGVSYDSGANSLFAMDWNIGVLSIVRKMPISVGYVGKGAGSHCAAENICIG